MKSVWTWLFCLLVCSELHAKTLIGVWAQPCESASKWLNDFGPDVVYVNPDRNNKTIPYKDAYALCASKGIKHIIDTPDNPEMLSFMLSSNLILMVNIGDEPSLKSPSYNVSPSGFKAFVDKWMADNRWIADSARGKKPLFLNHAGPKIGAGLPTQGYQGQNEAPYSLLTGPGDWLGHDWYPMNMQGQTGRYPNDYVGQALARINFWWPGRNPFVFLEAVFTGESPATGRLPTASDMEAQLASALAQGAKGIFFFTHALRGGCGWDRKGEAGKTCWDMRTPELVAKTKEIAARLNPQPSPSPSPSPTIQPTPRLDKLEQRVLALEEKLKNVVTDVTIKRGME